MVVRGGGGQWWSVVVAGGGYMLRNDQIGKISPSGASLKTERCRELWSLSYNSCALQVYTYSELAICL